jgi:NADPH-dependent 2,4-dienoyl-CoA reductase/sulfur reductase-like enzyme
LENPTKAACDHLKVSDSGAEHFVIIGGGAAGALAAESIRQAGFSGKVTVVSKEPYLPIDRIKLSKFLTSQADSIRLYQPDYLEKIKVNYMLGRTASQLNKNNNEITLDDGETIKYDKLLIATGGEPRRLPIPGSNLKNVFVLRALEDTQGIARAMEKVDGRPRVVIIGASFIGIEAAAMLSKSAASVTVVAIETVPLERVLGTEVGKVIMRLAQKNKVDFRLESSTKAFLSKDDDSESVGKVVLLDETSLEADIVVMGVGVRPATDFVKDTLPIEADGSLKVDSKLKVIGTANIFAAGDVASYPHYSTAESIRVEHWDVAQQQGRIAGHNMVVPDASNTDYKSVPFFFTLLWGKSVRYAGYAGLYDEVIIKGDVEGDTPTFAAYYAKGGKVLAVATMGMDPLAVHFSELLRVGMTLTSEEIRSGKVQMHFDFNNICLVSFGYRSITLKTLD